MILPQLGERIKGSALFRNTVTVVSGTVASQAIVFLASPILSRVFHVADFGNLANYNAWVLFLTLLSNLRYEQAVLVARGREKTNHVMVLSAVLTFGSCLIYALLAFSIHSLYHGTGYVAALNRIILFIPLGALLMGTASLFTQHCVKTGSFKILALSVTTQAVFTVGSQTVLGLLDVPNALIIGAIVGFAVSVTLFGIFFFREHSVAELRIGLSARELARTATEHLNFPRFMLAADAISTGAPQFVPVFVLALFDPAIAGLYAFSVRVIRVPMIVISGSLTGALRKESVDYVHANRALYPLFASTLRGLTLISIVPFVVTLVFGPQLFSFVFGHQWLEAGHIVQILSPGFH
jgi:O-antigen/teichoic acid export membrane protein